MDAISTHLLSQTDTSYIASFTIPANVSTATIKSTYLIKVNDVGDFVSARPVSNRTPKMESNTDDINISISAISNEGIPQHVYTARAIVSRAMDDMRVEYAERILPADDTVTSHTLAQRDAAIDIAKDLFFHTAHGAIDSSLRAKKYTSDGVKIQPLKKPPSPSLPETHILFPLEKIAPINWGGEFEIPQLAQQSLHEINSKKAANLVDKFLELEPDYFPLMRR